jgi:hypothetical protein
MPPESIWLVPSDLGEACFGLLEAICLWRVSPAIGADSLVSAASMAVGMGSASKDVVGLAALYRGESVGVVAPLADDVVADLAGTRTPTVQYVSDFATRAMCRAYLRGEFSETLLCSWAVDANEWDIPNELAYCEWEFEVAAPKNP